MAVAAGFEPAVGGYPTNAFEAFTFGRSDTPPPIRIEQTAACLQIWGGRTGVARVRGRTGVARVRGEPGGRPGWLGECAKCKANVRFLQIADQNRPQTDHYLQKSHRTGVGTEPGHQRSRRHASTPAPPHTKTSPAPGQNHPIPHPAPHPAVAKHKKTARRAQYTMHHTQTGGNPATKS